MKTLWNKIIVCVWGGGGGGGVIQGFAESLQQDSSNQSEIVSCTAVVQTIVLYTHYSTTSFK